MSEKSLPSAAVVKSRNIGFDLLKIFACFAVVVIHVSSNKWYEIDYNSFAWNVFTVYNCLARWAVPIFVMISGALFLNVDHSIEKMYKKYIRHIVTAFVFWAFVYACVYYVKDRDIIESLKLLFGGDYHMWYLFMIAGLYMITPLLKKLVEDEKLTKYFLLLSFVFAFAFVIPEIISVISMFSAKVASFAEGTVDKMHLNFVLGYTFYYVLGYYFTKVSITKKQLWTFACLGAIGVSVSAGLTCIFTNYKGELVKLFYEYLTVNVMFEAIFVFSLYTRFNRIGFSDKAKAVIIKMSKCSFGVYLVHVLVVNGTGYVFHFDTMSLNPIISVPLISIATFVISYAVSEIIHHIPVLKKYIV